MSLATCNTALGAVSSVWRTIALRLRRWPVTIRCTSEYRRICFFLHGRRSGRRIISDIEKLCEQPPAPLRKSLVMMTAYTYHIASFAEPVSRAKGKYCADRGYRFICYKDSEDFIKERAPTWSKVVFLLKAMEDDSVQWIFWTDADAVIVNRAVWIENLVDPTYDLIISRDGNGLNAGNFLIRNSQWSRDLLMKAWEREDLARKEFHEQEAIADLIDADWRGAKHRVKFVSQRLFNSYHYPDYLDMMKPRKGDGSFEPGDFMLHMPAMSETARIERMRKYWGDDARP